MPSEALVVTAKSWDQLKYTSTGEQTNYGTPYGETLLTNKKE